jgi:hypothetical protein
MFRASLAGAMLALSASTALAANFLPGQEYIYETSSTTAAAVGTNPSHLPISSVGGLCVPSTTGCNIPVLPGSAGPLVGGLISFITTPSASPGTNYVMSVNIQDLGATGDIYEVVVNGSSWGTTSITGLNDPTDGNSFGSLTGVVKGGTVTVGITDLLQQYIGQSNQLPALLGTPGSPPNGGTVAGASGQFASSTFFLDVELSAAPEPTSLVILGSGIAILAAAVGRKRRST